jgi:hypothetical protein
VRCTSATSSSTGRSARSLISGNVVLCRAATARGPDRAEPGRAIRCTGRACSDAGKRGGAGGLAGALASAGGAASPGASVTASGTGTSATGGRGAPAGWTLVDSLAGTAVFGSPGAAKRDTTGDWPGIATASVGRWRGTARIGGASAAGGNSTVAGAAEAASRCTAATRWACAWGTVSADRGAGDPERLGNGSPACGRGDAAGVGAPRTAATPLSSLSSFEPWGVPAAARRTGATSAAGRGRAETGATGCSVRVIGCREDALVIRPAEARGRSLRLASTTVVGRPGTVGMGLLPVAAPDPAVTGAGLKLGVVGPATVSPDGDSAAARWTCTTGRCKAGKLNVLGMPVRAAVPIRPPGASLRIRCRSRVPNEGLRQVARAEPKSCTAIGRTGRPTPWIGVSPAQPGLAVGAGRSGLAVRSAAAAVGGASAGRARRRT